MQTLKYEFTFDGGSDVFNWTGPVSTSYTGIVPAARILNTT